MDIWLGGEWLWPGLGGRRSSLVQSRGSFVLSVPYGGRFMPWHTSASFLRRFAGTSRRLQTPQHKRKPPNHGHRASHPASHARVDLTDTWSRMTWQLDCDNYPNWEHASRFIKSKPPLHVDKLVWCADNCRFPPTQKNADDNWDRGRMECRHNMADQWRLFT